MLADDVRIEGLHRGAMLPVEEHGAIEAVLFVARVDGKERPQLDLDGSAVCAGATLGTIFDGVGGRMREERRDLAKEEHRAVDGPVQRKPQPLRRHRGDVQPADDCEGRAKGGRARGMNDPNGMGEGTSDLRATGCRRLLAPNRGE